MVGAAKIQITIPDGYTFPSDDDINDAMSWSHRSGPITASRNIDDTQIIIITQGDSSATIPEGPVEFTIKNVKNPDTPDEARTVRNFHVSTLSTDNEIQETFRAEVDDTITPAATTMTTSTTATAATASTATGNEHEIVEECTDPKHVHVIQGDYAAGAESTMKLRLWPGITSDAA
jgi:hypothetical protein